MAFMKNFTIYEKGETLVYINQCYNKGKKTNFYAVRRNDKTGMAHYLGAIKWSGAWRQYVFQPEPQTQWSSGCKKKICEFEDMINKRHRDKLRLRKRRQTK